ncbi:MAG: tetratricopeptide repeat protein [Verrucomicrobiota bacterium]
MKTLLSIGLFLISALGLSAAVSNPQSIFEEANTFYGNGEYTEAIEAYQQLIPEHQSANIHYNMGNAYYRLGEFGPAILHFEKALALDPRNPDIRANLELTQEAAEVIPTSHSWANGLSDRFSANTWAWLAVTSFWASLGLIILAPLYRWRGPMRGGVTSLALVVLVVSCIGLYGWHVRAGYGVVLSDDARLSVAPTSSSPAAGTVKAGEMAKITQSHGDYYLVRIGSDKVGWLPKAQFSPVWDS